MNNNKHYLFNIISILGNNKNFKTSNDNYLLKLSFIKIYNSILILRIKKLLSLIKHKIYNLFFFYNIKQYYLGIKFTTYNNLKNNFKFFIYSLYNGNIILSHCNQIYKNKNTFKYFSNIFNVNNFYPYLNANSNLSKSFFYNFLYKDYFKSNNFNSLNIFFNYSYLRSNKKKRFKQKESEKLSILRENLNWSDDKPFRLKFYYRYFEYKRLHSYWNKEAFLEQKFKYFNQNTNNNLFLLHFFYKFRKFKFFANKYNLFRKNIFINFWLQTKINKFQFQSYKLNQPQKKTKVKFINFYLDYINKKTFFQKNKNFSTLLKYKKYFFNKKLNYLSNLKILDLSNKLFINKNFKNNLILKDFYSYKNFKNLKLNKNFHLFFNLTKHNNLIQNFSKKKKNFNAQFVNYNINKTTKYFIFNLFKNNKYFRIKFKYIRWLNQQRLLKTWKYNKYLSFKNVSFKNFKINSSNNIIDDLHLFTNNNYKYKGKFSIYNWLKYDFYISNLNLSKIKNISYIINNLNYSINNYFKNFSFYKSNKILDLKYTYLNLFKSKKLNTNIFKNKSKNNFILQKLSKNLFKKSWSIIYKQFSKDKKYKGFYNLVPIYNYLFINKVLKFYKKRIIYKIIHSYSSLLNNPLDKALFYRKILSNNNIININNVKLNLLNRVYSIRTIDKKYSFIKKRERQLLYSLKNYKNTQLLLLNSNNNKNSSNDILLLNNKLKLLDVQKIIKRLKNSLTLLSNSKFKQNYILENANLNLKINFFKKTSFLNFLRYNFKNTYSYNYFLINKIKNNLFNSFHLLEYSKKLKNINKLRLNLLNSKNIYTFILNKKKINFFINKLIINIHKKNNIIKYNLGLNFLLKKNYSVFLKLFKFFSLYKGLNLNNNTLGFGKLSNYLNINNENIFSIFNFYIYNFYNFFCEKTYLNDKISSSHYLSSFIYLNQQKITILNNNTTNILNYNYDILNKNNLLHNIIYSKSFIMKYMSLFNINKLNKLKLFKVSNKFLKYYNNYDKLFINFKFLQNNNNYYNNIGLELGLKKIYYNLIINYKNILII